MRYETWDDKQTGQKRSKLGVVLEGFSFLDSGRTDSGAPSEAPRARSAAVPAAASAAPEAAAEPETVPHEEDDVPF